MFIGISVAVFLYDVVSGGGLFVLARTSNPDAGTFQGEAARHRADVIAVTSQQQLSEATGPARARLARDYYTYLHLPMITGIVLFALGLRITIDQVGEPLRVHESATRRGAWDRARGLLAAVTWEELRALALGFSGVVGEGMGHAIRSRVVLDELVQRHDVQVVVSGRAHDYLAKRASAHLQVKKIWGFTIVADSAQFSACVTELGDPQYIGTALTIQTCLGFLLTTISIELIPRFVNLVGWRYAFMILAPGPLFIKNSPEVFWGVLGSMVIGNVLLIILNLPLIGLWIKVLQVPYFFLFPLILLFGIIGSYTTSGTSGDIVIMTIFGLVGYLMKKFAYEPAPMVLGLVIGPLLETAIRRSMIMSKGHIGIFFQRPIAAFFMGAALLMLLTPLFTRRRLGHEIIEKLEEQ